MEASRLWAVAIFVVLFAGVKAQGEWLAQLSSK